MAEERISGALTGESLNAVTAATEYFRREYSGIKSFNVYLFNSYTRTIVYIEIAKDVVVAEGLLDVNRCSGASKKSKRNSCFIMIYDSEMNLIEQYWTR